MIDPNKTSGEPSGSYYFQHMDVSPARQFRYHLAPPARDGAI